MTTINDLSTIDTIAGNDKFPIFSTANNDARKVTVTTLVSYLADGLEAGTVLISEIWVGGVKWAVGDGSPEGVVTAPVGSFYSRRDGGAGTSFYVKQSGAANTGWAAK